jgi:hypothetical protein
MFKKKEKNNSFSINDKFKIYLKNRKEKMTFFGFSKKIDWIILIIVLAVVFVILISSSLNSFNEVDKLIEEGIVIDTSVKDDVIDTEKLSKILKNFNEREDRFNALTNELEIQAPTSTEESIESEE